MPAAKDQHSIFHNVSAEPAVLVYAFAGFLYFSMMPNLIQQKVCSPESPPPVDFICNDTALLAEATDIVTVRATFKKTLPAIILLLAGLWRDSTGLNKPTIYFALFWEIVAICIEMFSYLNWTSSPWTTSITEGIINGFGGNIGLFFVGANCAIADNSKLEDRTSRLTLVSAEVSIGATLAYGLSGYILTYMGYVWFLIFCISLYLTAGVLVMMFIKERKTKEKRGDKCNSLKQLKSAFKRRPNITVIWFMVIASCLVSVLTLAELNVHQYYLQQTFGYSIEEAGMFASYRSLVGGVGSIIFSSILIKLIKWSDFQIGIVCSLITIISCILMAFATTTLEIKIFALLDIFKVLLIGVPKSIISKCVNEDGVGLFFTFCFIGECILPIIIYNLYDYIYTATFTTLPGAFYLASAAISMIFLIFYSISSCIYTPLEADNKKTNNVPEDLENSEKIAAAS